MKQTNTTASKMSDEEQLDTILNNVFGYLEVGESGIHGTDEEHRSALKRALLAWHQKELEKAKLEARIDEHIMVRDEWASPGIVHFKTTWSINRLKELSKLQKEQK